MPTEITLTKVDIGMMEDVGTSANQLVQLDSNAKVPAVDGSLLTGMSTTLSGASDPTLSTNPSGVGIKYKNTTDGEMFICTDATAGENVWTNVGGGTGDVKPFLVQGESYGFVMGGNGYSSGYPATLYLNRISKFAFASSSSGTDLADLTIGRQGVNGGKSSTYGYACGGEPLASPQGGRIEKFAFVSTANSTTVGELSVWRSMSSNSQSSGTYVYNAGGNVGPPLGERGTVIDKFAVASDADATNVGDLIEGGHSQSVSFDSTHGYVAGGYNTDPAVGTGSTCIQRFSFATDGNSTDVGDMFVGRFSNEGASSLTHGYSAGGAITAYQNTIQKYAMASSSTGTDVGDLLTSTGDGMGVMDTAYGYHVGGYPGNINVIQRYAFVSDGNAVDVGDMEQGTATGGSTET